MPKPTGSYGALQGWFEREGRALPKSERYRELRRWYARDRGVTTADEIAQRVECGARSRSGYYRGIQPCVGADAA